MAGSANAMRLISSSYIRPAWTVPVDPDRRHPPCAVCEIAENAAATICAVAAASIAHCPSRQRHPEVAGTARHDSDRASPTVFAGREDEFDLLNDAISGVQQGESGHTVVINGVQGAGKTALLNEYAARLLAEESDDDGPVIPVPLRPDDFDAPPAALVQAIDQQFVQSGNVRELLPSAQAPHSLDAALEDYASTRFGVKSSTFVLLLDEA